MKITYVVKGMVEHEGKFLFLKKVNDLLTPDNIGKWECPGGRLEKAEDAEQALLREIKEETDLDCKIDKEMPPVYSNADYGKNHCYVFLVKAPTKDVHLSNEHSDFVWVRTRRGK